MERKKELNCVCDGGDGECEEEQQRKWGALATADDKRVRIRTRRRAGKGSTHLVGIDHAVTICVALLPRCVALLAVHTC